MRNILLASVLMLFMAAPAHALTKAQAKAIIADMDAKGVPDTATFGVKMLDSSVMVINPNSYAIVGEDSDVTLDASDHWAGVASQASAVYFKQL